MIISHLISKELVILINIFLLSLIIITQFVSYPLFLKVNNRVFVEYHQSYTFYISTIVVPAMILELLLSLNLIVYSIDTFSILNIILVGVIWLSTFFLQVPIHNKLSHGYNIDLIKKLISTNWIRTSAWTFKLIICVYAYQEIV